MAAVARNAAVRPQGVRISARRGVNATLRPRTPPAVRLVHPHVGSGRKAPLLVQRVATPRSAPVSEEASSLDAAADPSEFNATPHNQALWSSFSRFAIPMAVGAAAATLMGASPALAAKEAIAAPIVADPADTCWILISTALVLFMTIPGLSAFYAGIVKRKNSLSVLMQCFTLTCVMSVLWYAVGYSLSFSEAGNPFIGGLDKVFLAGITKASVWETIPEALWAVYQMTFAIITPALMVGSFVERMKFNAVIYYCILWMFAVYFPACHMVWGPDGYMAAKGVLDFAGGIVVHITAGIGALVGCAMLGPRKDNRMVTGNLVLTVLGTGMLWVGWYGFNGGSAGTASADAAFAVLATQLCSATAAIVWSLQDIAQNGKASMLGIATGSIAGLATVTPAAGFIGPAGAIFLGVIAGILCRFFSLQLKEMLGYDDSLDVFGVHGVGGFIGTCLLGVAASPVFGGFNEVPMLTQTVVQCAAAAATTVYTAIASFICFKIAGAMAGGLRIPEEAEVGEGVDSYSHGEMSYDLDEETKVMPAFSPQSKGTAKGCSSDADFESRLADRQAWIAAWKAA